MGMAHGDDPCARAWAAVCDRLGRYPAGLREGTLHFARDVIAPTRYAGWLHPAALAQWCGLPSAVGETATIAHLVIYLTLALEDDLLDGEGRSRLSPRDLMVAIALMHWDAAGLLAEVAGGVAGFWQAAARARSWWGEATLWDVAIAPASRDLTAELRLRAGKAAALSVAPAAVLTAAGRSDLLPAAHRLLEAIYTAIILLDDLQDWEADLKAGQRNFLVELVRNGRLEMPLADKVAESLAVGGAGERLCAIAVEGLTVAQEGLPDGMLAPLRSHADRLIETCGAYADLCRAGARWVAAMLECGA